MFLGNPTIERCLSVINKVEDGKFSLLLNRIAQFLANGNTEKPFTSVEESKLESSLEISRADVEALVSGITEIFITSAYSVMKPSILSDHLQNSLHINPKKAEIFVQVWTASAKAIVENLKQKNFFPQLNHISYSVSVETASDSNSKGKQPKAQLQLNVSEAGKTQDINLEFTHDQLYEFYKKLEQIQGQLDALR